MPHQLNKVRVAFSVTNCICHDQRVLKMAGVVSNLDCDITIIGRESGSCCQVVTVPFNIRRFRMVFNKGFLFYKFFNIRLFLYLLFNRYDILVANDLDTLLPNFLVSRIKHLPLVYDSHEYFTGVPELNGRPFVKCVWKSIERRILPHLENVITVSESIAQLYKNEHRVYPVVIRNLSPSSELIMPYSRKEMGIPSGHLLLILQGGGINIDKGGEELIDAVMMTENVSLIIAGSGDVLPELKTKVARLNLSGHIKFFPMMPWDELMRLTKSADIGLSLEKDTNINYRFSLPNKLFDYISAGIPVIASNLPEISGIVETTGCGISISEVTPHEIGKAIIKLRDDSVLLNKLKENSVTASKILNWENESSKVKDVYLRILNEHI